MSLNPSCNLEGGRKGFPVIGDAPFNEKGRDIAIAELRTAGFPRGSEVVEVMEREQFKEGDVASEFNKDENNRKEVRVEGFAGGRDIVNEPVECYHIDTQRGLDAFIEMIKNR